MRVSWLNSHDLHSVTARAAASRRITTPVFSVCPTPGCCLSRCRPGTPISRSSRAVAEHLNGLGLSAPKTRVAAPAEGLYLVEDFGPRTFSSEIDRGRPEADLFSAAIDAITALHSAPNATTIDLPAYDADFLLSETLIFTDWFAPLANPDHDTEKFQADFTRHWRDALRPIASDRSALVLRDFHLDNLIHLPARPGVAACGLIDVQGARIGAPEYDLASLLQDARRDLEPGLEEVMLTRYPGRPPAGRKGFPCPLFPACRSATYQSCGAVHPPGQA